MRWVGYCRVSTDEQAESGLGLAAQEAAIRGKIKTTNDRLVDVVVDDGYSAKDTHRPGLQRVLAMISAGEADGVIVSKLDRISRSVPDFAAMLEWFGNADAVFSALDLGVDTSTPAGEMVAHVMLAIGQWERRIIGERTKDALAERKKQGKPISGPSAPPKLVARIRKMRDRGMTYQAIADRLNADKIPTMRGGVRWYPSSVQSALGYRQPRRRKPFKAPKVTRRAS